MRINSQNQKEEALKTQLHYKILRPSGTEMVD